MTKQELATFLGDVWNRIQAGDLDRAKGDLEGFISDLDRGYEGGDLSEVPAPPGTSRAAEFFRGVAATVAESYPGAVSVAVLVEPGDGSELRLSCRFPERSP